MAGTGTAAASRRTVPPAVRERLEDRLRVASEELDRLQHDVSCGIRNAGHYDQLEERGDGIARRIHIAFRGDRG